MEDDEIRTLVLAVVEIEKAISLIETRLRDRQSKGYEMALASLETARAQILGDKPN